MKPIKMFGLAALAALMAMAFVGASWAMAEETALCGVDEDPCESANQVTHVHETSVGKAKLLSSSNVECNVLFLGDVLLNENEEEEGYLQYLDSPLIIHGTFTYTSCGSCNLTEENGPGEIKILKMGHETAQVIGERLLHLNCFGFINCYYTALGLEGTAKGPLLSAQVPDSGEVSSQKQVVAFEKGSFCPIGVELDIVTTPLSATYITN